MSRRRTNPEDIRNPEHYFNSYIAREVRREQEAAKTSLLGWIDQIEDQRLYTAVSGLTERQKILLSLRYQRALSQKDVALVMGVTQQMVSASESRILRKIKKFFQ